MNYNLDRFNLEAEEVHTGLGFASMEELKAAAKTAILTMKATKGTPILPNLDEDETVALWYVFYGMLMAGEEADMGFSLIGNSVAEVCKAAAFNGFSTLDKLVEAMPDKVFQQLVSHF